MKIVIAGAAGFIGANLVSHLLQKTQHIIISIDDLSGTTTLNNLQHALAHKNDRHRFYLCDIGYRKILDSLFKLEKPDVIINLTKIEHDQLRTANELILYNSAISSNSVKKYITFNTDEIFIQPDTKIIINCCNIFGPKQDARSVIPTIIDRVLNNKNVDPLEKTDIEIEWMYINDLLEMIGIIIDKGEEKEIYDIRSGWELSKEDIFIFLNSIYKEQPIELNIKNISSHSNPFGWQPTKQLKRALEHTLQWYNLNRWALGENK